MHKKYLILILGAIVLLLFTAALSVGDEKAPAEKKGFVGAETCKGCHETQYDSYAKSVHSKKSVKGPESQDACETCHGPGAKHVEKGGGRGVDIFDFRKDVDVKARNAKCLACHGETRQIVNWNMSKHSSQDVACNDCHSPHVSKAKLLKADQPILCFECHKDIRAQSSKQSHHPVREGLIKCTDCHDVHGSFGNKQLKADSINELCYKCHADKRGPFMFEHPPVEENCLNCHTPHGSNHPKLLVSKPPQLCQSCHDAGRHPGNPYTQNSIFNGLSPSNKMYSRACLNCHSNIHGSNASGIYGQTYTR
jgi:DmsE family decaheme c-type cytochrome